MMDILEGDPPRVQPIGLHERQLTTTLPCSPDQRANNAPAYACLPPFSSLLARPEMNSLSYAAVVDQLFSAFFHSYFWTDAWRDEMKAWLGDPLVYMVSHISLRNFKASLPWLSVSCSPAAFYDCLCAEMLFSLFYLIDDIIDVKTMRYGQKTAYAKFGAQKNKDAWVRARSVEDDHAYSLFQGDAERARLWQESLEQIQISEDRRRAYYEALPLSDYEQRSKERTAFLGEWWKSAAARANNFELERVIDAIYPLCAVVGQVRNDFRNTDSREERDGGQRFSDFTDGRATAITILARERMAGRDRAWLEKNIWRRNNPLTPDEIGKLYEICRDLEVFNDLRTLIYKYIQQIERTIKKSHLTDDVKAIWLGWGFRQFRVSVVASPTEDDLAAKRLFIEAVRRLSKNAEAAPNALPTMYDC